MSMLLDIFLEIELNKMAEWMRVTLTAIKRTRLDTIPFPANPTVTSDRLKAISQTDAYKKTCSLYIAFVQSANPVPFINKLGSSPPKNTNLPQSTTIPNVYISLHNHFTISLFFTNIYCLKTSFQLLQWTTNRLDCECKVFLLISEIQVSSLSTECQSVRLLGCRSRSRPLNEKFQLLPRTNNLVFFPPKPV